MMSVSSCVSSFSRFQVQSKGISSKGSQLVFKRKICRKVVEPRVIVVILGTSICLVLLPLIYVMVFFSHISPLDLWNQVPITWTTGNDGAGGGGAGDGSGGGGAGLSPSRENTNVTRTEEDDSLKSLLGRLLRGKDRTVLETTGFACKSDPENDVCVAQQSVRMKTDGDEVALNVYLESSSNQSKNDQIQRMVMPYVKKNNDHAIKYVHPIKIQTLMQQSNYSCDVSYDVPAVVFTSGLIGNVFHELNEIIIPLFLTTHHFRSRFQFVITDFDPNWVRKYAQILSHLSNHEVINTSQDKRIHCFPAAVIGLHFHNDNLICKNSDLPVNCSISDFRQFLRESFGLKFKNLDHVGMQKPILVLISRRHSRRFLNQRDMVKIAKKLGFGVIVASPELTSNLDEFSRVVNRCSVLVGAHGAGLTNEVFLPEGAVMVQVVPLGLRWPSTHYYGMPLEEMGVHYLEYQINPQESTLMEVYGPDHPVIREPDSIDRQGWNVSRPIYIDSQQLRLNISKYKDTLVQALRLLGR